MSENPPSRPEMSPLDPLTMRLVQAWIEAEKEAGNYTELQNDSLTSIAIDRVKLVLGGEVRWSETTPGDRAIWQGRARDVERFNRRWRARDADQDPLSAEERNIARRNRRQGFTADRRYLNAWDTVRVVDAGDGSYYADAGFELIPGTGIAMSGRLFGNANVGNASLTSLQVPGMLAPGDAAAYVATMYATATDFDGLVAIADRVVATLVVGSTPIVQAPLRELVHGVPVRRTVPPREHLYVNLDMFSPRGIALRRFDPFHLVVHLEGVVSWARYDAPRSRSARTAPVEFYENADAARELMEALADGAPVADPATFARAAAGIPAGEVDPIDLARVCGVLLPNGNYCANPLAACGVHDAVPFRDDLGGAPGGSP